MHTLLLSMPLFGAPGLMEWILIGLAVVIFFGAAKLPKLGKGLGEGIRNFKKGIKGELEEDTTEKGDERESEKTGENSENKKGDS